MDSTQLGVSPQWRFCRLLDIQKLFIFKMKRWQFVYFAALWFLNKAFGSQTESVPIWRMGAVGGEDGIYFSFLTQGLFSCLSPRSRSPFSTGLNLSPGGVLVLAQFYSTDDISMMVDLILPEELKHLQQLMLL